MKKKSVKSARPSTYHHGDLRRALLDAALELVTTQGVQGFTLREAARAAQVSHNAPYRHFATRTELLIALAIEGQQLLLQSLQAALKEIRPRRARLLALGAAYLQFGCEHAAQFRVMYSSEVCTNCTDELTDAQAATFQFFEQEIQAGEADGLIQAGHTADHALVGWSAIHGATILILDGTLQGTDIFGGYAPTEMARLIIESLLDGIVVRKNEMVKKTRSSSH